MWLRDQEGSKYQIQVSHLLIIFSPVNRKEFPDNKQAFDGSIYMSLSATNFYLCLTSVSLKSLT